MRVSIKKNVFRLLPLLLLLCACSGEEKVNLELPDGNGIVFSQESQSCVSDGVKFGHAADSEIISFSAGQDWRAEVNSSSWCVVSPLSGVAGNGSITISVSENTEETGRNTTITLKAGKSMKTLKVVQKGKNEHVVVDEYVQASIGKDGETFFTDLSKLLEGNPEVSDFKLDISGCEILYKDGSKQLLAFSYAQAEGTELSNPVKEEPMYGWMADVPQVGNFDLVATTSTRAITDESIYQNTKFLRWAPFQDELGGWSFSEVLECSPLNITVIGNYTNQEATSTRLMDNLSEVGIIDIESHGSQGNFIFIPVKNIDRGIYEQVDNSLIVYFSSTYRKKVEKMEKAVGIPKEAFERSSYVKNGILFNNSCASSDAGGSLQKIFMEKGISTYAGYTNATNTAEVKKFMNLYTNKLFCDLKSNKESIPDNLGYSGTYIQEKEDGTFESTLVEGYFDVATSKEMCFVKFGPRGTVETKGEEIFLPFQFIGIQNLKPDCKVGIVISNKNRVDENITPQSKDYVVIGSVSVDNLAGKDNLRFKTTIKKLTDELDKTDIGSAGTKYYWVYLEYNNRYYISADYGTFTIEKEQSSEEIMREYLVKLYHDTDGDNWYNNTNWLSDLPIDKWHGVIKDWSDTDCYILELNNNNLNGEVNLRGCSYVATIKLNSNNLRDLNVVECFNLKSITCSSSNLLEIHVGGCKKLEMLYIPNNELTSLNLNGCKELITLNCSGNRLKGLDITPCHSIKNIACIDNQICSEIPPSFKSLYSFQHDVRFEYWYGGSLKDDRHNGWWYPGEPESGYHGWLDEKE